MSSIYTCLLLYSFLGYVAPHGYLKTPPQRSSMWRYGFGTPANYNDMGLNCGGTGVQHSRNGGKCGVCGDPYDATVKDNEAGGKYALGVIAGTYRSGEMIQAEVKITANHLGYFQFRLCPHNDPNTPVTQECLDRYLLTVGKAEDSNTKFHIGSDLGTYTVPVRLPPGVTCSQCVLQWTYTAGNNWGCEGEICGKGKGAQENFVNCADIAITGDSSNTITSDFSTTNTATEIAATQTQANTVPPTDQSRSETAMVTDRSTTTTTTTTTAPPKVNPSAKNEKCKGAGPWAGLQAMAGWCAINCERGFCPATHCDCSGQDPPTPSRLTCQGASLWRSVQAISSWCDRNCNHVPPFCPSSHCVCS